MDNDKNSLKAYLKDISASRLLSDAEEQALAARIQKGDSAALDALTQANLAYVVSLAHQYTGRGLALEDLISEGNMGMLAAAGKYGPAEGKRFVAFAAPYIREAMELAIEQQAGLYRVPRHVEDTRLEKKRSQALSIDAPVGGSPQLSLSHVLADENATIPGTDIERDALLHELRTLVDQLEGRERQVMQRLYPIDGETRTMAEVAQAMGLKRERVRQIRNRAIRRIGKQTRNAELRELLGVG